MCNDQLAPNPIKAQVVADFIVEFTSFGINDHPTLVGQPATNARETQGSKVGNLNQADHMHDM